MRRHVKVNEICILCGETPADRGFTSSSRNEIDDGWQSDVLRCELLEEPS